MLLKSLTLLSFKNVEEASLTFSPSINALVGDNGAGKTNVIDAVHYLSIAKSMMMTTDRQSVRHDSQFFVIDGEFESLQGKTQRVVCSFGRSGGKGAKCLKCNGKEYERLSDHIGVIPVVVVAPQDVTLIYDGAEERRRFLNSFCSQLDPQYLASLIQYNATLAQRNTLLKQGADGVMLDIYDMQLVERAETIFTKRKAIIEQLQPLVERYYAALSGGSETISLAYTSQLNQEEPFAEQLKTARGRDIALQYSSIGVHRDDIDFRIEGFPLRKYGSQGQQKSFLIALKLAQYQILSSERAERPILLLDDLFDKLDHSRVEQLLSIVGGDEFGQIFITDCNPERLELLLTEAATPYSLFDVERGKITPRQ